VAVNQKNSLLASSSKDETIVIWNMAFLRTNVKDAIIQTLNEHEHSIDCIKWAHAEACRVIDSAEYNKG